MCRLFGASFSTQAEATKWLSAFRLQGEANPDGWGIGIYANPVAAQVFKEEKKSTESKLFKFILDNPPKSKIFLAHLRKSSRSRPSFANSHPFSRELFGREYLFAHNGTLHGAEMANLNFTPLGETDSERAFCNLLDFIKEKADKNEFKKLEKKDFSSIAAKLREINSVQKNGCVGIMSCLFSDGERLYAYKDMNDKRALHFLQGEGFALVSTEPLSNDNWIPLAPGELLILKDGKRETLA